MVRNQFEILFHKLVSESFRNARIKACQFPSKCKQSLLINIWDQIQCSDGHQIQLGWTDNDPPISVECFCFVAEHF